MIKIHYCGACGDFGLVEKIKQRLSITAGIEEEEIEEIECGSCSMEVSYEGETVFSEESEILDIDGIVQKVRSREARA